MTVVFEITNNHFSGGMQMVGFSNERNYWVNEAETFAMWNDGQNGTAEDWVFGPYSNLGGDSSSDGFIFSNNGTATPCDVIEWYTSTSSTAPSYIGENTIVSQPLYLVPLTRDTIDECIDLEITNTHFSGGMRMGGIRNNRNYWVNEAQTFAVWNDGHSGADEDWVFGPFLNLGSSSSSDGYLFSNTGTDTPCDVADWYKSTSSTSTKIENTVVSKPVGKY